MKQKAKGPKGDCTITAEQLLQAPETYHQDAHPCKEPIEARGVCRRHYSMLKRFNPDGLAPKATNQRAQAATARVKPAREIPEGEAATRADFRGDAPLVNRIHDYDTYQTYVTDTSKPKSKVKLSTQGKALWLQLQDPIHQFYDKALKDLSFDDRLAFIHYFTKLQTNMSKL